MMTKGQEDRLTWVGEVPVPVSNSVILFQSYVLEQWLRRIARAALMAKAGELWARAIPEGIYGEARKQVNLLKKRTFLDPENSDNLIWALTLDQVRQILVAEDLTPFVFTLTGMSRRDLDRELVLLRELRNIVAHNRATNDVAVENFSLVASRLEVAIRTFKLRLLYHEGARVIGDDESDQTDVSYVVSLFTSSGLAANRDFLVYEHDRFYEFGVVLGDPVLLGGFVDVGGLLDLFHNVRDSVLCVCLPHQDSEGYGGELAVVWPKDVSNDCHAAIRDACLSIRRDSDISYEQQDVKHICDPLVWFERGRRGAAAAGSREAEAQLRRYMS